MPTTKKRILVITTGGTIAMKYEKDTGVVPCNELMEFLKSFSQLSEVADIDVYEFSNIPSPHMTPEMMFNLAKYLDDIIESSNGDTQSLQISDYDGAVITHGTDTLEETAFLLDLVLTTRKPVVLTAAMRSGNDIGLDGPRNIIGAVRVAAHANSIDKGVLVVMNDEIHTARDVLKADTGRVNSFESPGYGAIGYVDTDDVIYHRQILVRENVWTDKINSNVDLIKATSGIDDRYIRSSIENGAAGIVIEAFGKGNLPPNMIPSIQKAISLNIVVVVVSRVNTGRVLPEYGYLGGGKDLENYGVILGGDLKGPKARIKLMCLLGKYDDVDKIKKFF
ncbi:MAG: asparaginase [Candidatus Cloacimonetes bacterium]|nr:asparaginase [Candidatus Cloacimonadota bacterium]